LRIAAFTGTSSERNRSSSRTNDSVMTVAIRIGATVVATA
jgi:hypothetical protein